MANNSYCVFCFTPPCAKLEIYLANITFFLYHSYFCSNFAPSLLCVYVLSLYGLCYVAE